MCINRILTQVCKSSDKYVYSFIIIIFIIIEYLSLFCTVNIYFVKIMLKFIDKLCTPAYVYLVISSITILMMIIQNVGNTHSYCLGNASCNGVSTLLVFTIKIIYVIFWTWVLDLICGAGWEPISWVLVLLPFLLMFLILGTYMLNSSGNVSTLYYSSVM